MTIAKVFQSGNSQAIRIPKEVQTDLQEFLIRRVGKGYILCPVDDPWFPLRLSYSQYDEMPDNGEAMRSIRELLQAYAAEGTQIRTYTE